MVTNNSNLTAIFLPKTVEDFVGPSRLRAVLKELPCDFQVDELRRQYQTTFGPQSDLPPNMPVYDTGLVNLSMLCDRQTTAGGIEKVRCLLDLPRHVRISAAGLKDRWAWTSQAIVLPYKDLSKLRRILASQGSFEEAMRRHGVFLKDPHSAPCHLGKGHLEGNRFTIKVKLEGASKAVLQDYMEAAMEKAVSMKNGASLGDVAKVMNLGDKDILVPNAYGNQRQGARQNLSRVGETLIVHGAEAAFKHFLTETTSNEGHRARDLRKELAKEWAAAEAAIVEQKRKAAESGSQAEIERASKLSVCSMRMSLQGMLELLDKPDRFSNNRPAYEVCNMVYEWKLVRAMFFHLDVESVLRDKEVRDDISLWIGAYQSYFFNQLLAKTITGELHLASLIEELGMIVDTLVDDHRLKGSFRKQNLQMCQLPLFSCEKVAVAFYQRFMPEAIPAQIDPLVRELFLCAGGNGKGPWRPPYVVPKGLEWYCEDGAVNFRFTLRSGAFATTFLGTLFNLVEAKKESNRNKNKGRGNRR